MYLYKITAKHVEIKLTDYQKHLNNEYEGLLNANFAGTFSFEKEPTADNAMDIINFLRPGHKYYLGSVIITFIREVKPNY